MIDYYTHYNLVKNDPDNRFFTTNNAFEGYNNRMRLRFGKMKAPI